MIQNECVYDMKSKSKRTTIQTVNSPDAVLVQDAVNVGMCTTSRRKGATVC